MAVLGWDTPRELLVLLTWVRLKSEHPQGGSRSRCCPYQQVRLQALVQVLVRNKNVKGALELTELKNLHWCLVPNYFSRQPLMSHQTHFCDFFPQTMLFNLCSRPRHHI